MSLIKNPNELTSVGPWAGLIYGEPGTGKSTLALSSPNPVMLDADNGMKRVQKRFQMPSLPMKSYQDVLDLLDTTELDAFDTIVPDTLGAMVAMIGDWVMLKDPKNRKKDGSLALAGYGAINTEFARFVRLVKSKGKYLLFVAHGKEEKDGDSTKVRPDCVGSSGKELVKTLDFMGYIEMHGDDRRTISFSPTEKFYAKNSLGLPNFIEIPDPNKVGNIFIQKNIIEKAAQRAAEEAEENTRYDKIVDANCNAIGSVKDAATADAALTAILAQPVLWDSQRVAKNLLNDKIKSLGLTYDKDAKAFKAAPAAPAQQNAEQKQPDNAEKPAESAQVPATQKWDVLATGLMEGVSQCATGEQLDAYLKAQQADFDQMMLAGEQTLLKQIETAVIAKRASFAQGKAA